MKSPAPLSAFSVLASELLNLKKITRPGTCICRQHQEKQSHSFPGEGAFCFCEMLNSSCSVNSSMLSSFLLLTCCIHFLIVKKREAIREEHSHSLNTRPTNRFAPMSLPLRSTPCPYLGDLSLLLSNQPLHVYALPPFPTYLASCIPLPSSCTISFVMRWVILMSPKTFL